MRIASVRAYRVVRPVAICVGLSVSSVAGAADPFSCVELKQMIAVERRIILLESQEPEHPPACPSGIKSLCNQKFHNDQAILRQLLADYARMKCVT